MYANFVLPFSIGAAYLFIVLIYKYASWFTALSTEQKGLVKSSIFTTKSLKAISEIIKESLLHISIFRHNLLLGYMHVSLAFGWFLLIVVGSIEADVVLGELSPIYVHIFFKYFHPVATTAAAVVFANIMDLLLLFVLSGVALALYKRIAKRSMGMKKRSQHNLIDRVALTALWLIFPIRLLCESVTAGVYNSGGFLTGSIGSALSELPHLEMFMMPLWWSYSIVLGVFFVMMPYTRYMHILTEIPHIFLRFWGVRPCENSSKSDNFQIQACSRCGICIDACQLQSELEIRTIQPVYFLREKRAGKTLAQTIENCMMCGRCQEACPVNIDINTLRLSSRSQEKSISEDRYSYLNDNLPTATPNVKFGYYAGCMTRLTPAILKSMNDIFEKSGDSVTRLDQEGVVCCGRPLKLNGELEAAQRLVECNKKLILNSGIKVLIVSCPICLKSFKEDYQLEQAGIEIIHHTQYITRSINEGKITPKSNPELEVSYHDPCELGRGLGIYSEPRKAINSVSKLVEIPQNRNMAYCCGHSLANNRLLHQEKNQVAMGVLDVVPTKTLITACPQCKTAFLANRKGIKVMDICELVASNL